MKVIIKDLYTGKDCYKYSEQVEESIANIIAYNLHVTSYNQTVGYDPRYDFMLNDKRIELKITSKTTPHIEFARGDGRVSGLLLSEADYYIILSPGGSKCKYVGKLRMYKTSDLKKLMVESLYSQNIITYPKSNNSPGSMCYELNPKCGIFDYWLGDCDLIQDNRKVIGYELSSFTPSYGKFINNAITALGNK